jgi:aminopeptidase YwaD
MMAPHMSQIDFKAMARECLARTDALIGAHGPRRTGSAACMNTADEMAAELRDFSDLVTVERFTVHPGSFYSYTKLLPASYALGVVTLFATGGPFNLIPLAGLVVGVALMLCQFAFYVPFGDRLFSAKTGCNVEAVIEPVGRAERELILSGHHDSAPVARIFSGPFRKLYAVAIFLPYAFFFIEGGLLVSALAGGKPRTVAWLVVVLAGLPSVVGYFLMVSLRRGSPGAGDNLIASCMVSRLGKEIAARRDELLRTTRLRIVSFDAEEAGLRGAAAYMRAHAPALGKLPCFHLNFDSIYRLDCLKALTSDINGTVALSATMVADLVACADQRGYRLGRFAILFGAGGTDAAESARRGIESTTIIAMPTEIIRGDLVYHTAEDTVAQIEPSAVEACLSIAAGYLAKLESEASEGHG